MRKKSYLSLAIIGVALVTGLSFGNRVSAASVTDTTEVVDANQQNNEDTNPAADNNDNRRANNTNRNRDNANQGGDDNANDGNQDAANNNDQGAVDDANATQEGQVLGARRNANVSDYVTSGAITNKNATDNLNPAAIATLLSAYLGSSLSADDIAILDSMELEPAEGITVSPENPLEVSFSFPGVTASTRAYVLHFGNGAWEVVPTTVSDGIITGTFTSLSPVAIAVEKATLQGSVLGANRAISPRTGYYDDVPYVAITAIVLATLLGSVFLYSKRKLK